MYVTGTYSRLRIIGHCIMLVNSLYITIDELQQCRSMRTMRRTDGHLLQHRSYADEIQLYLDTFFLRSKEPRIDFSRRRP